MSRLRHHLGCALLLACALTACGSREAPGGGGQPAALPADHPPLVEGGEPRPRQAPDTVLAEVNGRQITVADLDVAVAGLSGADRLEFVAPGALTDLVEALVDRHLQADAAAAAGLPVDEWLARELGREPAPTPDEIAGYYAAHEAEFRVPARVQVTRVSVASRDLAAQAQLELARGATFSDLRARAEVAGFEVDQLWLQDVAGMPVTAAAALALGPGEVSDVLEIPAGYAVLRAEARLPASARPLADVSDGIRARLADGRRQAAGARLRERLRKDARIVLSSAAIAAYATAAGAAP